MLGNRLDIADINREYEINGVSVYGSIAFYPAFVVRYFKSKGYKVYVTYNVNEFDNDTVQNAEANIIYYTKKSSGHYVAFYYGDSKYWGYNVLGNNYVAYCMGESIYDFLDDYGYLGRILISIYRS